MRQSAKLTDKEKQNGKRAILIPSEDIQEKMQPITIQQFTDLVKKTIQLSKQPDLKEK
jgi:hypothetical protein